MLTLINGEANKADEFLEAVNNDLPTGMELEFEGFYQRGLFVTKKRYALIQDDDIMVKGLELVTCNYQYI